MTTTYGLGGDWRSEYSSHKEAMWHAFSQMDFDSRLKVLVSEFWPMLVFAVGYFVYEPNGVLSIGRARSRYQCSCTDARWDTRAI